MSEQYRIERDSLGEIKVPKDALYQAQTQRAIDNFPISGLPIPRGLIRALGLVKHAAASANEALGLLDAERARVIREASEEVEGGQHDRHFPIDVFQTGSGTSSNMNANEVISTRATALLGDKVHPNDHVNMSQSSNDVIPTAIHVGAALLAREALLPALAHLSATLAKKAEQHKDVVKTGRTHLMDAMPIRLDQEIGAWKAQIDAAAARVGDSLARVYELAIGGTAVGTGVNAHPEFGGKVAELLAERTGLPFVSAPNKFQHMAAQDAAVELSGQLKALAVALTKIANDLRWMNSGPIAGLAEISLGALQPGSSIMPGKINPVIPEAVCMVAAQIIGNDAAITIGGQAGNFQLNVMLPMIAHNLMQSLHIAATAARQLADQAIADFTVNEDTTRGLLDKNPILVTALNRVIGYDLGAKIAKTAYKEKRPLKDVAREMTDLDDAQLDALLDPRQLTEGGIHE
ncbi:MAG: class II fumarate hydratase [bacterium]|nr:class II fumarate hydratase [Myxococcales bacterium]